MLKILGKASSINVRKVLWTCAEIGLPFAREDWGGGFRSTNEAPFLRLNPNALVPVLLDEDFVLWESNAICRYLALKAGRTDLLPSEPRARASVEQWMDWQATDLNTAWRYAFMALVRKSAAHTDPAQIDSSVAAWNALMGILDRQIGSTNAYAAGARFTLADIVLGVSLNRWNLTPFAKPELVEIRRYWERLASRDGFKEHVANGLP
jgi:glutathione S-transferase